MNAVDPTHWLHRFTPTEWIRAAMKELAAAEASYGVRNARAGLAGLRRAAGMALNGALIVEPNESWGRTYVEHLAALARDTSVPEAVQVAARALTDAPPPTTQIVILRTPAQDERLREAAKDVIAHAYAVVVRHGADS
jgi:HEPN domain-containing protein